MGNRVRDPRSGMGRRSLLAMVAVGVGLGAWACDGSNAFQPVTTAPRIVELEAPSPSPSGEALRVAVRAVGVAPLDSLKVMLRVGTFSGERRADAETGQVDLSAEFTFDIPLQVTDTLATLSALTVDREGNVSPLVERRVRILDSAPPEVTATVTPASPELGGDARIDVAATDNVGLRRLGVRVLSPDSVVLFADSIDASGRSDAASFTWPVPETLPPGGGYVLAPFAMDLDGNRSVPGTQALALVDELPPVIAFLAPASGSFVVAGDSVLVTVRVRDNDGVERVRIQGLAIQGDSELGTEVRVPRFGPRETEFLTLPGDTTISRYLVYTPPAEEDRPQVASETLGIVVTAWDASGQESTGERLMQLRHDVNPPQVTILDYSQDQVVDPAAIDTVRVTVSDLQGLVRTGVRFVTLEAQQITGSAVDGTLSVQALADPVNFFPQDPPAVQARTLEGELGPIAPSSAPRGAYYLIATARDTIGNMAADTVRLFRDPPPAGVGGFGAALDPWGRSGSAPSPPPPSP
jgi:hypothetical protein